MVRATLERPIRGGVFDSIDQADHAVAGLLAAGFRNEQISVLCSDRQTEHHFQKYEHEEPAGYYTPQALAAGGIAGAVLAVTTAVAVVTATGTDGILTIGIIAALAGAVVGAFVGAMLTRGSEGELANYYDQAVPPGKILVAVDDESDQSQRTLDEAAHVLAEWGARPIELAKG